MNWALGHLCAHNRLSWARRTSWGWRDDCDNTVLQTQDSKFETWRSEAKHATCRSRRLPTIPTLTRGWGRNIFCFSQTAGTGNRTPNSGVKVKGSGANHYPRAPARAYMGHNTRKSMGRVLCVVRRYYSMLSKYWSSPLGWHQFSFLIPYRSSVSHGSCFDFFQNFHIFTNIFNQHFYETRSNSNKLFVYLEDDWVFSQHWATCCWHRPSVV